MFKMMQRILLLLIVTAWLPVQAQVEAAESLGVMVDQSGLQRMLSQRMVKAYAQILFDVDPEEAREQLEDAATLFDRRLDELTRQAPSQKVSTSLQKVDEIWHDFRPVVQGPVNRDGLRALLGLDDSLLKAANDAVHDLQEHAGTAPARLVNTAGRQRMLSQRIAKLYMLASGGVRSPELDQQLLSARYEFEGALAHLQQAPENTSEITRGLKEVERQWIIFRTSFQLHEDGEGKYIPYLVARAAEKIFRQMDQITAQYVQVGQ